MKSFCLGCLVLVNLIVGAAVSFFMWLVSAWMIDDSGADKMTDGDWANLAIIRAIEGLIIAAGFFFVFGFMNRFVFSYLFPEKKKPRWIYAGAVGFAIALSAVLGCWRFCVEKPYM